MAAVARLFVFHDFGNCIVALRTFERAPIVVGLVRFNCSKPHRLAAFRARREFNLEVLTLGMGLGLRHVAPTSLKMRERRNTNHKRAPWDGSISKDILQCEIPLAKTRFANRSLLWTYEILFGEIRAN